MPLLNVIVADVVDDDIFGMTGTLFCAGVVAELLFFDELVEP